MHEELCLAFEGPLPVGIEEGWGVGGGTVTGRNRGRASGGGGRGSPLPGSPPSLTHLPPPQCSFLIGEDGLVYEGRGWDLKGSHASRWNNKAIGITFMGNFMGECAATCDRGCLGAGIGTAQCVAMERLRPPRVL